MVLKTKFLNIRQDKLYLGFILFFLVLLPFQPKTPPLTIGIILSALLFLISGDYKEKLNRLFSNPFSILFLLYFFWTLLGTFYSVDPKKAGEDLVLKLPFLAWPLIASGFDMSYKQIRLILKAFVIALAISMAYLFIDAYLQYQNTADSLEFHFVKLVDYQVIPPHYMGMYLNFGYALLLWNRLSNKALFPKVVDVLLIILFVLSVVFIGVRMQHLVFVFVSLFIAWKFGIDKFGLIKALAISTFTLILFFLLAWIYGGTRSRMIDTYNEIKSFEKPIDNKQTNHRKFLWIAALENIQERPFLGSGTGGADQHMHEKLMDDTALFWNGTGTYTLSEKIYNCHNVFIQHWVANGIIGLILVLSFFIVAFARYKRYAIPLAFLLICFFSFSTESMLERQAGVLFFTFFYSFFFMMKTVRKDDKQKMKIEEH